MLNCTSIKQSCDNCIIKTFNQTIAYFPCNPENSLVSFAHTFTQYKVLICLLFEAKLISWYPRQITSLSAIAIKNLTKLLKALLQTIY